MTTALPRIVVQPALQAPPRASGTGEDPLLALIDVLRSPQNNVRAFDLARALIAEGKSFARTPSGRRWASLLSRSTIVENGWLLWNHANLDLSSPTTGRTGDSPAAMLEDVLRRLTSGDLESYVVALGALLAEDSASSAPAERQ